MEKQKRFTCVGACVRVCVCVYAQKRRHKSERHGLLDEATVKRTLQAKKQ